MVSFICDITSSDVSDDCLILKGAIALMDSEFPEGNRQEAINSILCVGTESKLFDCQLVFEGSESCGQFEDAGVVCQGK